MKNDKIISVIDSVDYFLIGMAFSGFLIRSSTFSSWLTAAFWPLIIVVYIFANIRRYLVRKKPRAATQQD